MTKNLKAKEAHVDLQIAKRLALIVMALFPALWGLLGFLNDATDFNGTVNNAVRPMIAMTNTYDNPWQTWRAITAPWAAPVGLAAIMTTEGIAGILGAIGVATMLVNLRASAAAFARGKAWMILGCLAAVLVWGIGFLVIAGDWFLAWERNKDPLNAQAGAMIYFLPCALALIAALIHRDDAG
jgi:predicted small integral membrane protein